MPSAVIPARVPPHGPGLQSVGHRQPRELVDDPEARIVRQGKADTACAHCQAEEKRGGTELIRHGSEDCRGGDEGESGVPERDPKDLREEEGQQQDGDGPSGHGVDQVGAHPGFVQHAAVRAARTTDQNHQAAISDGLLIEHRSLFLEIWPNADRRHQEPDEQTDVRITDELQEVRNRMVDLHEPNECTDKDDDDRQREEEERAGGRDRRTVRDFRLSPIEVLCRKAVARGIVDRLVPTHPLRVEDRGHDHSRSRHHDAVGDEHPKRYADLIRHDDGPRGSEAQVRG